MFLEWSTLRNYSFFLEWSTLRNYSFSLVLVRAKEGIPDKIDMEESVVIQLSTKSEMTKGFIDIVIYLRNFFC